MRWRCRCGPPAPPLPAPAVPIPFLGCCLPSPLPCLPAARPCLPGSSCCRPAAAYYLLGCWLGAERHSFGIAINAWHRTATRHCKSDCLPHGQTSPASEEYLFSDGLALPWLASEQARWSHQGRRQLRRTDERELTAGLKMGSYWWRNRCVASFLTAT